MFARVASVFVLALPLLATATTIPRNNLANADNACNSGSLECCNSVQAASSKDASTLLGVVGVAVGTVTGLVGLTCSPVTALGVGGNSCNQQAACCTNTSFNGVIALGCTPININL